VPEAFRFGKTRADYARRLAVRGSALNNHNLGMVSADVYARSDFIGHDSKKFKKSTPLKIRQ